MNSCNAAKQREHIAMSPILMCQLPFAVLFTPPRAAHAAPDKQSESAGDRHRGV